jgi:hypothetical protein
MDTVSDMEIRIVKNQSDEEKFEALVKLGASKLQARSIIAIGKGESEGDIKTITEAELAELIEHSRNLPKPLSAPRNGNHTPGRNGHASTAKSSPPKAAR